MPQSKLRPGPEGDLLLPDCRGKITYYKHFLSQQDADELLRATENARSWARTPVTFFGKQVLQPRDTAFFGTKLYTYSDERRKPTGWHEDPPASNALHEIGKRIESLLGLPQDWFNVILANRYKNGRDFMGWHSDNERSLGKEPIIASISLGAERRFLVRLRKAYQQEQPPEKVEYVLAHGSLLVMSGKMQSYYQHALPKVALSKCNELRLNFTYRRVVNESDHSKDQPGVERQPCSEETDVSLTTCDVDSKRLRI
ncbi:Oxoglutarate/iron-dependent dioxygenase [Gracilaria domingensis]|nr:Oxoglutarate/iron-dependent dioxygenase [Gracilaria domingensis]